MKRFFSLFALGALSAYALAAQTSASGQSGASMNAQANAQGHAPSASTPSGTSAKAPASSATNAKKATSTVTIAAGTKVDATLVSWVDASKSRVGDPVEARIEQDVKQGGKVVLKKGSQLTGHVIAARSRAGAQPESEVGISFERAMLPNGQSMTFQATIVALSAPPANPATGAGAMMNTSNAASSTTNGTMNADVRSSGAAGQASPSRLSSNSKGVLGMEGVSLGSAKSGPKQGSMIVSNKKNIRLNSGTEMMLQTSNQAR